MQYSILYYTYRIFGGYITLSARKGPEIGVPSVAIQWWLGTWQRAVTKQGLHIARGF